MGIAEQKLSPTERRDIALTLLPGAKDAAKGRLQAKCPFHSDKNPSFYYSWQEDWYRCYGCDERGDLCRLYGRLHNLDDKDGFREFARRYMGGVEAKGKRGYETPPPPKPAVPPDRFTPGDPPHAPDVWADRALKFADYAHDQIFDPANAAALDYLHGRGLTDETIRRFRLGWNPKDYFRPRQAWGLPAEKKPNGNWRHLRLAMGWVIPTIVDGRVWRLKIRQTPETLRNPDEAKYLQVPGGSQRTWLLCPGRRVFVLVETEFDALLVFQAAGDLVGVVPFGSASAKPDQAVFPLLQKASLLINALDFDKAGGVNTGWWAKHFGHNHERCPPPEGKDLGDYVQAGGDLRAWILACLPSPLRNVMLEKRPDDNMPDSLNEQAASADKMPDSLNEQTASADKMSDSLESVPEVARPVYTVSENQQAIPDVEERMGREIEDPDLRKNALELSLLLRVTPEITAVAYPGGGMGLRWPSGWDRDPNNDARLCRVSRLFFSEVGDAYSRYVRLQVVSPDKMPGPMRGGA